MTDAPAPPGRLRVVTWNVRAGIGPGEPFPPAWWRHVRPDRLERIGAVLRALHPDVVTLQEVTIMTPNGVVHDQPAELAAITGLHARYSAAHAYPLVEPETGRTIGSATWGNAILARQRLAEGFAVGLPRPADDDLVEPADVDHPLAGVRYGDVEPGHREPRCAVGSVVGGGVGAATIVTTHLTYIGLEQRRRQAAAVAELAAVSGPVIVTGDFNAEAGAPEIAPLGSTLTDAFGAVGIGVGDQRRGTFGSQAIDHVLVRGLDVVACSVATEAGDLSDHWPVVADLVVS